MDSLSVTTGGVLGLTLIIILYPSGLVILLLSETKVSAISLPRTENTTK